MKNDSLNEDLKTILASLDNIESVSKSDRNGATIEIVNKYPQSFETYIYKKNVSDRDKDFDVLVSAIKTTNLMRGIKIIN